MADPCPKCGLPAVEVPRRDEEIAEDRRPVEAEPEPPPAAVAPLPAAAALWARAVAVLLDYAVVAAARLCFGLSARLVWGSRVETSPVLGASAEAFHVFYWIAYVVLLHWIWGQTLGKMALSIRVVTVPGGSLSLGRAALRQLGFLLSLATLGLGLALAAVRSDRRALHDLVAGTRVERVGPAVSSDPARLTEDVDA